MTNIHPTNRNTATGLLPEQQGERGAALIAVLLLLMMLSGLSAALVVNGQTETLISRNERAGTQAEVAAEAGLNHAVELVTTYIADWSANGHDSVDAAIDALLVGPDGLSGTVATDADNGSLGARAGIDAAEQIALGAQVAIAAGVDAQYEAFVMDDDATAPDEPGGSAYDDENGKIIIRATGYATDDSKVVLEGTLSELLMGAVVINGDLDIGGSAAITGSGGGVHTNGDLIIHGSGSTVTGTITASGSYTGYIPGTGGTTELPIPEISASNYLDQADYILTSTGTVTLPDGTVLCDTGGASKGSSTCYGWDFNSGSVEWSIGINETPTDGTYYVEGAVVISGSPGTLGNGATKNTPAPVNLSIIAEGSIDISGSPTIAADTPDLLFVTDGDLEISGTPDATSGGGQILVHEQVKITGNLSAIGQLIVEDAAVSVDGLVTTNDISGNVTITYNGDLGTGTFTVTGWRDVRDVD